MFGYRQVVFIQTTILIIIITLEVPLWGFSCMKPKYIRINRHRQMSLFVKTVAKIPIESKTTLKHCFEITNKIMVFHPILLCVRLILWTYLFSFSCTCTIWVCKSHWLDIFLLYIVTGRNNSFSGTPAKCYLLRFWKLIVNPVHFLLTENIKSVNQGVIV